MVPRLVPEGRLIIAQHGHHAEHGRAGYTVNKSVASVPEGRLNLRFRRASVVPTGLSAQIYAPFSPGRPCCARCPARVADVLGYYRPSLRDEAASATHHPPSVPLVLGTPVIRGSGSTAMRSARAAALKMPSAM